MNTEEGKIVRPLAEVAADGTRLSVRQRLVPIFEALLQEPDADIQWLSGRRGSWCRWCSSGVRNNFPSDHHQCNLFRLVHRGGDDEIEVKIPAPVACRALHIDAKAVVLEYGDLDKMRCAIDRINGLIKG